MPSAPDWSIEEIEITVAEYFAMLHAELAGVPYVKRHHNERARLRLNNRTPASVEFKFQNISAVLVNHDYPYVKGYLPAQNYQAALEASVLERIETAHELGELLRLTKSSPVVDPASPTTVPRFSDILVGPPDQRRTARPKGRTRPIKIDFVRLDAENRRLGTAGEAFVFELEQRRLHDEEKRPDLAKKVRWVARDEGDGLGYDIASFEASGAPRLIEVKTTGAGKYFPFFVTRNEVVVSREEQAKYHLYRLYDFGEAPSLYILAGALDEACALEATQFRASFRHTVE